MSEPSASTEFTSLPKTARPFGKYPLTIERVPPEMSTVHSLFESYSLPVYTPLTRVVEPPNVLTAALFLPVTLARYTFAVYPKLCGLEGQGS